MQALSAAASRRGTSLERWSRQAAAIPRLTPVEELHLARLVQRAQRPKASTGDRRAGLRARQRMVSANLRLVLKIASSYRQRLWASWLQLDDLVQEGCLGLNRAAEKFDPEAGCRFSTYAFIWIRQAMHHALLRHQHSAGSAALPLILDTLADPRATPPWEQLDYQAALALLQTSGIDLMPHLRLVLGGDSLTSLSREQGISKQTLSKRLQRQRAKLSVVAQPFENLLRDAG
jgi:RNA polymerase sigma factor (sigma-70 family)